MRAAAAVALAVLGLTGAARDAAAQELGNKLLGAVGVNAGTQPEPGVYLLDRFVVYRASELRDRNGERLPIDALDIDVVANVLGVSWTHALREALYFNAALGAPLARIELSADEPLVAIDAAGFGDIFVQPLRLGWRSARFDVAAGYTFYAPTGRFEPRRPSVGRGFWTHQLSLGAAYHADRTQRRRASFLASYDMHGRKRGIDITRGNTIQVQGGAGTRIAGPLDAGLAAFALWQVTDNRGADLPDVARGLRSRAFGLGPELGLILPSIRTRLDVRAEWELGVRARQDGWVLVVGVSYLACCAARAR